MNRPNPYINVNSDNEIVISGIAGRFPNSDNLKVLHANLLYKMDLGSSNHGRWNNCNKLFFLHSDIFLIILGKYLILEINRYFVLEKNIHILC